MFTPSNLSLFFTQFRSGKKIIDKLHEKHQFDIVYSNTLAVLLGILYTRVRRIRHIWHVHEIIESPKLFRWAFGRLLLLRNNTHIVYNSKATGMFWDKNSPLSRKSSVIYNGIETNIPVIGIDEIRSIRHTVFNSGEKLVVALVGRISRWKGQQVLLDAFKKLGRTDVKLVFIGSPPPGQENFLESLNTSIKAYRLSEDVQIVPFTQDITRVWHAVDIAVVPSTEPEPFGLVAIEAMLAGKPLIASNHGGLKEIVVDGTTGFLVDPGNSDALSKSLDQLISDQALRERFGENGRQRVRNEFSVSTYVNKFELLFEFVCKTA